MFYSSFTHSVRLVWHDAYSNQPKERNKMTVKEMIEELSKVDPSIEVRVRGTLGNFARVKSVRQASTGENMSKHDVEAGEDSKPIFLIQ
jgi:hypothetical protein